MSQSEQLQPPLALTAESLNGKLLTGAELTALLQANAARDKGKPSYNPLLVMDLEFALERVLEIFDVLAGTPHYSLNVLSISDAQCFVEVGPASCKVMLMPVKNPHQLAAQLLLKRDPEGMVTGFGSLTVSMMNLMPLPDDGVIPK